MAVLVMDTATTVLAAAVGDELNLLASTGVIVPRGHSRLIQPALASVLQMSGLTAADVDLIAVGVGPGSYTGVRMGVSTGKAMAQALSVPIVAVSSLFTMAEAAVPGSAQHAVVVPLLYARRERAFGAIYEKRGETWETVYPVQVQPVSDWMNQVADYKRSHPESTLHCVHDFVPRYGLDEMLHQAPFAVTQHIHSIAGSLGSALYRHAIQLRGAAVTGEELHHLVPDYALQVEAEVKLAEKSGL